MSKRSPARSFRRLIKDRKGLGTIELALVLPGLLLMLLGMTDMSRFISARIDVEQAAQRTTDYALAKRPSSDNATYLRNEAASAAGVSTNNVTAQIFLECDGVRQSNLNDTCPSGHTPERFVSISINRQVQTLFDWQALASVFGANVMASNITVTGNSLVRFQ